VSRETPIVRYFAQDPVILAFHKDRSPVRFLIGPRGSGKSGSGIMEGMTAAAEQTPNRQGLRRSKFLVLRDTYRQLLTTTIPSFKKWLGYATKFSGQYPIIARTHVPLADGTKVDMETTFLAMDGENIIDNLQSFEASFAWINEARGIERPDVVSMVKATCGRFPSKDEEGCKRWFVVGDTNPPDEFHWLYHADMVESVEGWTIFKQVPPLIYKGPVGNYLPKRDLYEPNPAATYARIQNAGYDYWLDMIPGSSDAFIRTMVMGQYGTLVTGKPVYEKSWHEDCISAKPLEIADALTVHVGIDTSGLHPAAVFGQIAGGRLNIVREIHVEDTPFEEFLEGAFAPFVMEHFPRNPIMCHLDPSNPRSGIGGKNALQIMGKFGYEATLASTNRINARLGAVTYLLQRRNAMSIDPSCKLIIEGFRGKYHYKKMESSGLIVAHRPIPEKNKYADVHDGLQYLSLGASATSRRVEYHAPKQQVLWA
jgi:hypothetical protein